MQHLLSVDDLNKQDIDKIFWSIKYPQGLSGKILATAFFEPSTRTKLSFQTAMYKLGGQVIDLDNNSSLKKGESEADTIKTLSQYANIVAIRHPGHKDYMKALAFSSEVPVINAGDGANEHPTQALTDLYTINQYMDRKKQLTIMFTGDLYYSRTIHSLLKILKLSDYDLKLIFTNEVNYDLIDYNIFGSCIFGDEKIINNCIKEVDVLYMTRLQKERFDHPLKKKIQSNFILEMDLVNKMKTDAIIMHPLPRNKEIHPAVDCDARAKYFKQVKNGTEVRQSLLFHMLHS